MTSGIGSGSGRIVEPTWRCCQDQETESMSNLLAIAITNLLYVDWIMKTKRWCAFRLDSCSWYVLDLLRNFLRSSSSPRLLAGRKQVLPCSIEIEIYLLSIQNFSFTATPKKPTVVDVLASQSAIFLSLLYVLLILCP